MLANIVHGATKISIPHSAQTHTFIFSTKHEAAKSGNNAGKITADYIVQYGMQSGTKRATTNRKTDELDRQEERRK